MYLSIKKNPLNFQRDLDDHFGDILFLHVVTIVTALMEVPHSPIVLLAIYLSRFTSGKLRTTYFSQCTLTLS